MVRIHFTSGVPNFDTDFQMRTKNPQLFVKKTFQNFNFWGWGPQKTKALKWIFGHNSKRICRRKTCNISLDAYLKCLNF